MSNRTALIIDDDEGLLVAFRATLEMDDFEVTTLSDSRQAMEMIRNLMPKVVTLDVDMPDISGIQLLKAIRTDVTLDDIKVVMITASREIYDDPSIMDRADLILMKPVSLRQLRDFVSRMTH